MFGNVIHYSGEHSLPWSRPSHPGRPRGRRGRAKAARGERPDRLALRPRVRPVSPRAAPL